MTTEEVRAAIECLYDETDPCAAGSGIVGGHLHVVLDDYNFRDSDIAFCVQEARAASCQTCLAIGEALATMPKRELFSMMEAIRGHQIPDEWGVLDS